MMRRNSKWFVSDQYLLPLLVVLVSLIALSLAIAALGGMGDPIGF